MTSQSSQPVSATHVDLERQVLLTLKVATVRRVVLCVQSVEYVVGCLLLVVGCLDFGLINYIGSPGIRNLGQPNATFLSCDVDRLKHVHFMILAVSELHIAS